MNLRANKGEKMSLYNNLKEIYKDTTQIIQGKDSAGKIVYLLKTLSFVVVFLIMGFSLLSASEFLPTEKWRCAKQ